MQNAWHVLASASAGAGAGAGAGANQSSLSPGPDIEGPWGRQSTIISGRFRRSANRCQFNSFLREKKKKTTNKWPDRVKKAPAEWTIR